MTTAVILAAGAGRRLGSREPKCLIKVGSATLLERYVGALEAIGVESLVVITSRESSFVSSELLRIGAPQWVSVACTPYRTKGALSTLSYALGKVDGPLLVMDSDVLFPIRAIDKLLESGHSALLLDTTKTATGEEMMAGLDSSGLVREVGRDLQQHWPCVGESLGLAYLDVRGVQLTKRIVDRLMATREAPYLEWEVAISRVAQLIPIRGAIADELPWVEIDFPADVVAARKLVHSVDSLDLLYMKGQKHDSQASHRISADSQEGGDRLL